MLYIIYVTVIGICRGGDPPCLRKQNKNMKDLLLFVNPIKREETRNYRETIDKPNNKTCKNK